MCFLCYGDTVCFPWGWNWIAIDRYYWVWAAENYRTDILGQRPANILSRSLPRSEMERQADRECDSVLPAQGCRTQQRMDEYRRKVEQWFARENWIKTMNNLLQCLFVQHDSHMKPPGIEPETLRWDILVSPLECDISVRDYAVLIIRGTSRQERLSEAGQRYAKANKGNAKRLWPFTYPDLIFWLSFCRMFLTL